ncbi:MAG: metallophosphoesterase [Pyrinomonadaceae bacterium]
MRYLPHRSRAGLLLRVLALPALVCAALWLGTPRPVAQTNQVRFAVVGDFGDAGAAEQDVANLINGWQPDFVITTGDNNYPAGEAATIDANIGQYYHQFIYPYTGAYGAGAAFNRFFPVLGNHDWGSAYPNPAGAQPYLDYFTLPGNERYYDFVRGPLHFFAIDSDPNEPDGTTSTSVQGDWLRTRLAASSARWKLVYFHHPPYSSGPHGSDTGMQWPFQSWGASAVLSGHDHDYERLSVNGLPYFVNGLGGRSLYAFGPPLSESVVRYNDDYGAMLVTASDQAITYQFINRAGAIIDTFTVNAPPVTAGQVLISEFRLRGPNGADDEFVELYNNTNAPLSVGTSDGSAGWALVASDGNVRYVVPSGTSIPARGHFLVVNNNPTGGYSLAPPGDGAYTLDVPDGAGLALFRTADPAQFTAVNLIDAAGFDSVSNALYREGAGLPLVGTNIDAGAQPSFMRLLTTGVPQDTNDNAQDFVLISTTGGSFGGTTPSILGAPGAENLSSPIQRNAQLKAALIDPQAASTAAPNRVRDQTPNVCGNPATCVQGTLTIRRKFTNKTGMSVSALRFRIVDVTTLNTPNPGGAQADLRAIDSADVTVTTTAGSNVLVKGTMLEQPATQNSGGGLNSSLVVALSGGALAPNAGVNVQFVLGVEASGRFRFLVNVEALTGATTPSRSLKYNGAGKQLH